MVRYFEPAWEGASDASAIAAGCIEAGASAVLLDEGVAPPDFYDLSSRMAGELLHQLGKYGIRLTVVAAEPSGYSAPFQDFVLEANRGDRCRFFATREEAMSWLEG